MGKVFILLLEAQFFDFQSDNGDPRFFVIPLPIPYKLHHTLLRNLPPIPNLEPLNLLVVQQPQHGKPIVSNPSLNSTFFSAVHWPKAPRAMVRREAGNWTVSRALHWLNAYTPMDSRLFEKVMDLRLLQL